MQGPSPSPASQFGTRAWFRPRCYTAHVLLATCVAFPTGKYTTIYKEGFTYTSRNFMLTYTSRNVIYTIICKWWNMKYIGDAGRHLADRFRQQIHDIRYHIARQVPTHFNISDHCGFSNILSDRARLTHRRTLGHHLVFSMGYQSLHGLNTHHSWM